MKTKTPLITKLRKNPWIMSTFVLSIVLIILLVQNVSNNPPRDFNVFNSKEACSKISGTPAWVSTNGNILDYGYKPFKDDPDYIVDQLIQNKVYFLYNLNCGYCDAQIKYFSLSWIKYMDSGFAIDCSI